MTIVNSTPPYAVFYDDNGSPLSGGKVYTYTAGTLTPRATYTDQGGLTPNANPVILDAAGRADIWLDNSASYKFIVKTSADVTIKTVDNVAPFSTSSGLSVLGTIAANSIVGNNTGAPAVPTALTVTQVAAMLPTLQTVGSMVVTSTTGTTIIPADDTIPQNTEGDQYLTLAITPKSATNILYIDVVLHCAHSADGRICAALFQDSTVGSLACGGIQISSAALGCVNFRYKMTAGTTSSTTFKVRAGSNGAGTFTFNGLGGSRLYGGVLTSSIVIREVAP